MVWNFGVIKVSTSILFEKILSVNVCKRGVTVEGEGKCIPKESLDMRIKQDMRPTILADLKGTGETPKRKYHVVWTIEG